MLDRRMIEASVERWLAEDVGAGDLTSEIVLPPGAVADLLVQTREDIVVAGLDVAIAVFRHCEPGATVEVMTPDGSRCGKGAAIARVKGPARGLLTGERTALNILQRMSGIATLTATYVDRIRHTRAQLIDTRKTTPGLRSFEKHAVVLGGGRNHRLGLDGGIMIKDNHIAVCGSIAAAVARAKAGVPFLTKIEVECDRLDQVRQALDAGADVIMLDNMSLADLREAVALVGGRVALEASGGVNLDTIKGIAETGVDFISVGRITQSAPCVDIGLDAAVTA